MTDQRRIIRGLSTFLCTVTNCWMTDRGCAINRTVAKKIQSFIKAGIPVYIIADHLVDRMHECMKCDKFGEDESKEINEIVRKEVDKLLKEIEDLLKLEEGGDKDHEVRKEQKRRWWDENRKNRKETR